MCSIPDNYVIIHQYLNIKHLTLKQVKQQMFEYHLMCCYQSVSVGLETCFIHSKVWTVE